MAKQLTYSQEFAVGSAGSPATGDAGSLKSVALVNNTASDLACGIMVKRDATEGQLARLSSGSDKVFGIVLNSFARETGTLGASGDLAVCNGDTANVATRGEIQVRVEVAVAVTDPVYVRHTASGGNTTLGAFRNTADTASALLVKGAYFTKSAGAGGIASVYFDLAAALT